MLTLKTFAQNEPALRFWEGLGFSHRMVQLVAPVDRVGGVLDEHLERRTTGG